jgi:hypothetical protein
VTTLLAHVVVNPGYEGVFEDLGRMLYQQTHANEARCDRYEYWRGEDDRHYYVLLSFDSFDGFITHQVAEYHDGAGPDLKDCFESFRLEFVDPIADASPLPPCETSAPVPEGASDLWAHYVRNHAADTPGWWATRR